ncbi:unnamed protein product [Sympodiomycopsis kandeliae]
MTEYDLRRRQIVSLHLRNFCPPSPSPSTSSPSSPIVLHQVSLCISSSHSSSVYLTNPSDPCIHADWNLTHQASLARLKRFNITAWASKQGQEEWKYAWSREVDQDELQSLPGGLASRHFSRLPSNSLIIGMQTYPHSSSSTTRSNDKSPMQIRYYLVPSKQHRTTRQGSSKDRAIADEGHDKNPMASMEAHSEGEDYESSGSNSKSSDREGGYDSETALELSPSKRPGLQGRRRSSSRTIKNLNRDRRRTSSTAANTNPASSSTHTSREDKTRQWLLERERENQVLERSKWETRMLNSYDIQAFKEIISAQAEYTQEFSCLQGEKQEYAQMVQCPDGRFSLDRKRSHLQGRVETLTGIQEEEQNTIRTLRQRLASQKEELIRRRARLDFVKRSLKTGSSRDIHAQPSMSSLASRSRSLSTAIHNRRSTLLETVSQIYPIQLISASNLLYSICSLPLPLDLGSGPEEEISAALNVVCQVVLLCSWYLRTPLHYDMYLIGSQSLITDEISMIHGPRGFPLYSKGVEQYRFEYGVFLLNKNIEQLMNVHDIPVLDINHILPNLNNLLVTLSCPQQQDVSSSNGQQQLEEKKRMQSYKLIGKGEILLSTTTDQDKHKEIPTTDGQDGHVDQKDVANARTDSKALSWTASLFGRSSRSTTAATTR